MKLHTSSQTGFTLTELLIVISIISTLSVSMLIGVQSAIERAKVVEAIKIFKEIEAAADTYYADTGRWPEPYRLSQSNDPINNNSLMTNVAGVSGWNGPYLKVYPQKHPWTGFVGFGFYDRNGDGIQDPCIVFDDDRPRTDPSNPTGSTYNNMGYILIGSAQRIDYLLDDGNLATGNIIGNGTIPTAVTGGEIMMYID